ncbi:MAG: right-handed parallel beta-helix repeat-containing protein [Polyangia bacterium]
MRGKAVLLFWLAAIAPGGCGGDSPSVADGGADGEPVEDIGPGSCPDGFGEESGELFYVDPAGGDDENGDGSQQNPWASIQYVIDNYVDSKDQHGEPYHENAPVRAGDTIALVGAEGHDQALSVSGLYNDDYVTIRGLEYREPVISSIHFRGSAYWRIDGLSFVNGEAGTMVRAEDHDWQGPCHHIGIYNCHLTSGDLQTVEDFASRASTGIWLLHDPERITVSCNQIERVGQAITAAGRYLDILNNQIDFFSRDAIATGGHHNRFVGNRIHDAIKLGDGHHDDFFQSHMGSEPDVSSDIEVAYNIFTNRYSDAYPIEMQGATQCLSAFEEGPKTNIRVFNNVCKTDHFHGIRWADTNDSLFVNNTVVGGTELPGLPQQAHEQEWPEHSWISVDGTGNTVRNNLTTLDQTDGDHNLELSGDEVYDYFVDWEGLDLSLLESAPAVDSGNPEGAPADDVLGNPRDDAPDVGAYEHQGE